MAVAGLAKQKISAVMNSFHDTTSIALIARNCCSLTWAPIWKAMGKEYTGRGATVCTDVHRTSVCSDVLMTSVCSDVLRTRVGSDVLMTSVCNDVHRTSVCDDVFRTSV